VRWDSTRNAQWCGLGAPQGQHPVARHWRAVSGGTCAGLLPVCPARIFYRAIRGALRHANFDRSTAICAS
jgi:hypothetical protein